MASTPDPEGYIRGSYARIRGSELLLCLGQYDGRRSGDTRLREPKVLDRELKEANEGACIRWCGEVCYAIFSQARSQAYWLGGGNYYECYTIVVVAR